MTAAEVPFPTDKDAPRRLRVAERVPPHDLDAEAAVIGAALLKPEAAVDAVGIVGPDDFYKPLHKTLWAELVKLVSDAGYVDPIQLVDQMVVAGVERGDASTVVMQAQADVPSVSRVRTYASFVVDHAHRRAQIMLAAQLSDALFNGDGMTATQARTKLLELADTSGASKVGKALKNANLVDWSEFWDHETATEEWVAWPLVPKGRAVALWAPAKAGKSTVVLAVAAAVATGSSILGRPNGNRPVHILYLDYEMTLDDLRERLEELGYGPGVDFSHLHYALLPSLPPLNTPEGAAQLLDLAKSCGAELVVIDTFSRANGGADENDARTTQDFYEHTGKTLKREGIAYLRTDHAGKDVDRGQRGSSAKNDDVDVVWQLTRSDDGVSLKRTHSRIPWVPEELPISRSVTDTTITYAVASGSLYPIGATELARKMDQIKLPLDASKNDARAAGLKARNTLMVAALRYRREQAQTIRLGGNAGPGPHFSTGQGPLEGTDDENTF